MDLYCILSVIFLHIFTSSLALKGIPKECPEIVHKRGHFAGVHEGTCYMFVDKEVFWKDASEYCQQMGGDLVTIKDGGTMTYLKQQLNSPELSWDKNGVWIGARHTEKKGWIWVTGDKVVYSYWDRGEPSRFIGLFKLENCALMRRKQDWRWHDYHCGTLKFHYNFICQFPIAYSFAENGHSPHTSVGEGESNGNMSILLIVIGLAILIIFSMLVIFFIYRKRQKTKHNVEDVVVRFENRGYGPVDQNDQNGNFSENGRQSRPVSNIYMSPDEVSTLYEEVQKDFDHGNNVYLKAINSDADHLPPPPPPRSDSMSIASSNCEGAVGGVAIDDDSTRSDASQLEEPLIGATAALPPPKECGPKGGNLYVDMNGGSKSSNLDAGSKSSLDSVHKPLNRDDVTNKSSDPEVDSLEKKDKLLSEHTYTNTTDLKPSSVEDSYEELPAKP